MQDQDLKLTLLTELCREWLNQHTPGEIGNDVAKIHLLKRAATELDVGSTQIPPFIQELYQEVFLRSFSQVAANPT